jgi:hypothetical protein
VTAANVGTAGAKRRASTRPVTGAEQRADGDEPDDVRDLALGEELLADDAEDDDAGDDEER